MRQTATKQPTAATKHSTASELPWQCTHTIMHATVSAHILLSGRLHATLQQGVDQTRSHLAPLVLQLVIVAVKADLTLTTSKQ